MASLLQGYEPQLLWQEFQAISNIPRCSKCESQVLAYISAQAREKGLETRSDTCGNLVVVLPATAGCGDRPGVVIQGHVDMVCEQNTGNGHDFEKEPVRLKIEGEWLCADGTTLGADNGIAVAAMLALIKGEFPHPALELLFTVEEETALTGALELDPSMISYKRLINIDSEEEGCFYIGCAGGRDTVAHVPLQWEAVPGGMVYGELAVTGLNGAHSGADIHTEPGNSLVIAGRLLFELGALIRIADLRGGDKHNAVPREAFIGMYYHPEDRERIEAAVQLLLGILRSEYCGSEKRLNIELKSAGEPGRSDVLADDVQKKIVNLMNIIPHGVCSMSRAIEGLVSTSTNFASMRIRENELLVVTSQRSDVQSQLDDIARRTSAAFLLAGGWMEKQSAYPPWRPDIGSDLLAIAREAYVELTGKEPTVTCIHAGLECGVIGDKFDGMDMISLGPDIRGAHTPEEKVHIESTRRVFSFLLELLARLR